MHSTDNSAIDGRSCILVRHSLYCLQSEAKNPPLTAHLNIHIVWPTAFQQSKPSHFTVARNTHIRRACIVTVVFWSVSCKEGGYHLPNYSCTSLDWSRISTPFSRSNSQKSLYCNRRIKVSQKIFPKHSTYRRSVECLLHKHNLTLKTSVSSQFVGDQKKIVTSFIMWRLLGPRPTTMPNLMTVAHTHFAGSPKFQTDGHRSHNCSQKAI